MGRSVNSVASRKRRKKILGDGIIDTWKKDEKERKLKDAKGLAKMAPAMTKVTQERPWQAKHHLHENKELV